MRELLTRSKAMATNLKGRDLLTLHNYSPEEIEGIIDVALELKRELRERGGHVRQPLAGKSIALYFEKKSLRTRVSFEVGIHQLGGHAVFLNSSQTHAGRGEPLRDTARVLDRYVSGIIYRACRHDDIVTVANNFDKPVINALCEKAHPCQALADLMTIYEKKGRNAKPKVAYVGDANNIAASLMIVLSKVGIGLSLACPKEYLPDEALWGKVQGYAKSSGCEVTLTDDPAKAVAGVDIVYTDVWISMGMEGEEDERRKDFAGYMVDNAMMKKAAPGALFMHDLPAHRGEEVADEVIEGPQSIVFDQAENRLHAQKAVMTLLMGG